LETDDTITIDIQLTRDLLDLLREKDVHSFQGFGMTVVFNEKPESYVPPNAVAAATIEDDGHSTSAKRVDGFRNPMAFPWQNGKVLTFKGSLE
jgi:hypothetical protein